MSPRERLTRLTRRTGPIAATGRAGAAGVAGSTGSGRTGTCRASARSIWLISFTDLMCLMLGFFVLAFSMAEPEPPHWQAMAASLAARKTDGASGAVFNVAMLDPRSPISLDYLATLLRVQFSGREDLPGVVAVRQDDRVVLGLPDALLFEPELSQISAPGRRALFVLGGVLGRIGNRIEVTAHAERETTAADGERDGWELSLSRAVAVATALRQAGYARRLVVRSVAAVAGSAAAGRGHLMDIVVRDLEEER